MTGRRIRIAVRTYLDGLPADTAVSCVDIANALGRDSNVVSDCLSRLKAAGEVKKNPAGNQTTYQLTGKPSGARRVGRDEDHYRTRQRTLMQARRDAARAKAPPREPATARLPPPRPTAAKAVPLPPISSIDFERAGGVVEVLPGFYQERPRYSDLSKFVR